MPKGGNPQGIGASVVVCDRESLLHGKGKQVYRLILCEVRAMRTAETIIKVLQERGKAKTNLEKVYRLLYNKNLYLKAYANIYPNAGAMTRGVTDETADGMSIDKIDEIIEDIRHERFKWTPVKRIYIPKKNGNKRPLGIPTWKDKLVQEVIRIILNAYYDRRFWKYSHGFRTGKGCHTALQEIGKVWKGTIWFIEGDIEKCFDNITHELLIQIIGKNVQDNRFLRLLSNMLKAGYMEEWKYYKTYSGTPQGGIVTIPTMLQTAPFGAKFKRG